jgi:calcineurin-like phosphoesterase family protein
MIYFTADTHFSHRNIIDCVNRPFKTVEEMDQTILDNINKTVFSSDTLYILGDFTCWGSYTKCMKYRSKIHCENIHLILGNHDRRFIFNGKESPFESEKDYYEIRKFDRLFCLSHYPMLSWNGRDRGSIMLHGHIHSNERSNGINKWQGIKRYDVGVDANGYTPVSIDFLEYWFEH